MKRFLRFLPNAWWRLRAWRIWFSYVRWRLETYGAYSPSTGLKWSSLLQLVRQFPSYACWLKEMDRIRGAARAASSNS